MRRSPTAGAITAALAIVVGCLCGAVSAAPETAGATDIQIGLADVTPVSWVDGQGRQYTFYDSRFSAGSLVVSRDLTSGRPDPSWGTYLGDVGVKAITLTPPTNTAVTLDPLVAVTDSGILSTTWRVGNCTIAATCDRWFVRYSGLDGSLVGTPTLVTGSAPTLRALRDGSFLTATSLDAGGTEDGDVTWRGPDGANQGVPLTTPREMFGADVDSAGRLLLALDGSLLRWPVGGEGSDGFVTRCTEPTGQEGFRVGVAADADGGFAIACAEGAAFFVNRYDADGGDLWHTDTTDPSLPVLQPSHAAIDDSGRVWVASDGGSFPLLGLSRPVVVGSFTASGPSSVGYERPTRSGSSGNYAYDVGGGITDLRSVPDGHVAITDLQACCFFNVGGGHGFSSSVHSRVLPARPGIPACAVSQLKVIAADDTSIDVSFRPCSSPLPNEVPTGYHVIGAVTDPITVDVGPGTPGTATTVHLPVTAGGRLEAVGVQAFNDLGDGSALVDVRTVQPFTTTRAFTDRQYLDLTGHESLDSPGKAGQIDLGQLDPVILTATLLDTGLAHTDVEPVARLYRAFFLRDPDLGGLKHWVAKHRAGMRLVTVASQFAASSEFHRRYGNLTNAGFVAQLYQNVFGRTPDSEGAAYWLRRLDAHTITRGGVVLQFSESSEGKRRSAPRVQALSTTFLLLGRRPTTAEYSIAASATSPHHDVAAHVFASHEYALRQN